MSSYKLRIYYWILDWSRQMDFFRTVAYSATGCSALHSISKPTLSLPARSLFWNCYDHDDA